MYAHYIKKAAGSFVKEHGVTSETISSLKFLSNIAEKESYKVYRFDDENDRVIRALNAESFCRTNIAFSVRQGDMRCIFIKSDVPDKTAARLLLHELAHIRLHHLDKCQTTASITENDADVFVNYVCAMVCGNVRKTRCRILIIVTCLIAVTMCYAVFSRGQNDPEYLKYAPLDSVTDEITDTVYITDTGNKYHKQDCFHLKDRHVTAVDIDVAESLGKEPCKDCFGR